MPQQIGASVPMPAPHSWYSEAQIYYKIKTDSYHSRHRYQNSCRFKQRWNIYVSFSPLCDESVVNINHAWAERPWTSTCATDAMTSQADPMASMGGPNGGMNRDSQPGVLYRGKVRKILGATEWQGPRKIWKKIGLVQVGGPQFFLW